MKIFVYSDCHWSSSSSILRGHGEKYSLRLENLILSVNWAEKMSKKVGANLVVCCGDFFDKSSLNSEEISALSEIEWNTDAQHVMLVGNHEMWNNGVEISSSNIFKMLQFFVADNPYTELKSFGEICFIPYTEENDIKKIVAREYSGKRIIFSHNDICGIQMGKFISKNGFDLKDIESCCDLYVNGHLHNGEIIGNKIINIGNLTGQNFSEDATKYKHCALVIDTDTFEYEEIENPNALNFYKVRYENLYGNLNSFKNGVLTVLCREEDVEKCRELLSDKNNIVSYKILLDRGKKTNSAAQQLNKLQRVDHIEQFKEYIVSELGDSDVIKQELLEVCR